MKILVFTSLYPNNVWPHHGVFVKERMTQVSRLDQCEVKVVAPVPYFPPIKISHRWRFSQVRRYEIIEGVEVHHPRFFMIPKVGMALYGLMMFLSVLPLVQKIRKEFDFDLIDAHYLYPDAFAALLLGLFFKKPVVVSARGTDINLFTKFPVIRKLIQYTLRKSDGAIAVSESLKEVMVPLGIPKDKISVITNGVDPKKFYPFSKEQARNKLGLPDRKIILSVGNLTPNKGFHLIIKALRLLLDEFHEKELYLVIAGEGEYRQALEGLIRSLGLSEHVRLVGSVPHEELYLWYNAADLFCLASSREGWPNVILESLICGTPVIATSVGGIPEIIRSDEVGILVNRSEHDIAVGISLALKKTWQFDAITREASKHTWARAGDSVVKLFESVLKARGGLSISQRMKA
jgi:glycosyltransferase involved in cell wall biosynthesis